ncbi:ImuA family protein [Aurantiacibacter flavus]|uniref:RecA-like protein n=1 Tax=Aurantiacibacter flavus TaxID=3145232 RepID=A0ABV0CUQ1_9SPHN
MELASLPRAAELVHAGTRNPRWHPGAAPALHSEIFAASSDGGGMGALLALAGAALRQRERGRVEERALLWVQDKAAIRLSGRPYPPGLPQALRHRVIHVAADSAKDALFALEEGLRCRDLACVIGEIAGNPKEMSFTASRRLTLAAERHDVPLFVLRHDARLDLGSARMRWQVRSAPSVPPLWDRGAPGHPSWHAELFRARGHAPGEWTLRDDGHALGAERIAAPDHGDLVPDADARSLETG